MNADIALVGCGFMGSALARGWLKQGCSRLVIVEPNLERWHQFKDDACVVPIPDLSALPGERLPKILVLAIKPQAMPQALGAYRRFDSHETLVISVAAGKSLAFFDDYFPNSAIVRAMPNLPASIGRGITVAIANRRTSIDCKVEANDALSACGEVAWVSDEALIDPVTAVSGGGPAYLFLLMEALAQAGQEAGLPLDLAQRLARSTVIGASELVLQSGSSPAALREAVSSPGGTTLAALTVLMGKGGLPDLMKQAVAAASARSRALALPEE